MRKPRLSAFAMILGVATSSLAADERFPMRLGVRTEPGEVFGVPPDMGSRLRRLYPGEKLEVLLTASFAHVDASGLDNATLTRQLIPCVVPGDVESLLGTPEPFTCQPMTGVAWDVVPCENATGQLCAELTATDFRVAAGTYTVFVILEDARLLSQLGPAAARQLRSTSVRVVTGPPANADEKLSAKLNAAYRAMEAQDAGAQEALAKDILAEHPQSVLALWVLADAQEAGGHPAAALRTFRKALSVLDQGTDLRTPAMHDPQHREARRRGLMHAIGELEEKAAAPTRQRSQGTR